MSARNLALAIPLFLLTPALQAQVDLSTKLPENTTQQFSLNKKVEQTLTINGNDISSAIEEHALLEASYGERKDGLLPIEYRYAAWQADIDVNGDKLHFDAANPDQDAGDSAIAVVLDGYRQMAKLPFQLTVDENGRVSDFQGWDKILDGLHDKSKALHEQMFEGRYLRELWTAEMQRMPDQPVKVDDTWQREFEYRFHGGQSFTLTTKFRYLGQVEGIGRKLEKVEMRTTDVQYHMNAAADAVLIVSDSDLKVSDAKGEVLFDPAKRQVVQIKESFRIQGDLTFTVTASDKELPGKLNLHLESEQLLLP